MKKKVVLIISASLLTLITSAIIGTSVAYAGLDPTKGCVTRPGEDDGRCVTDGSMYFCKNAWPFRNCVKGGGEQ